MAKLSRAGGNPELEIRFGDANLGVYRIYRWRAGQTPEQIRAGADNARFTLGPAAELEHASISYEAIIQSPRTGFDQPYAMFLAIHQDGEVVAGGSIAESGKLNPDAAKSISGLISFEFS